MAGFSRSLCVALLIGSVPIVASTACASTRTSQIDAAVTPLGSYERLLVTASSDVPGAEEQLRFLEGTAVARFKSRGLYQDVVAGSRTERGGRGIELQLHVTQLHAVDPNLRGAIAPLSGQDKVVVTAQLIELSTGRALGHLEVQGVSDAFLTGPSTPDVYQAIDGVVERVIEYFVRYR